MKLYSISREAVKDESLLSEYAAAEQTGDLRLGENTLFFKVRLRTYFVPYQDIDKAFRRVFTIPAGSGRQIEMENLVICDAEKEIAQIRLPGKEAAKDVLKKLHELAPHIHH